MQCALRCRQRALHRQASEGTLGMYEYIPTETSSISLLLGVLLQPGLSGRLCFPYPLLFACARCLPHPYVLLPSSIQE